MNLTSVKGGFLFFSGEFPGGGSVTTMIRRTYLIRYACIAKGTTVLADFSSANASALAAIAARCLEKTPPFHSMFTHTVRWRTYTYLIEEPFVYFAISDDQLEKSEILAFLKSLKDSFVKVFNGNREPENLNSYCFQSELNPIIRQLLNPERNSHDRFLQFGSGSIRERVKPNLDQVPNKMEKRSFLEENKIGRRNIEKEDDENMRTGVESVRELPVLGSKNGGKKVWKKQVWVVLSVDLIICVMLFGVWLCLCSGLKCIDK